MAEPTLRPASGVILQAYAGLLLWDNKNARISGASENCVSILKLSLKEIFSLPPEKVLGKEVTSRLYGESRRQDEIVGGFLSRNSEIIEFSIENKDPFSEIVLYYSRGGIPGEKLVVAGQFAQTVAGAESFRDALEALFALGRAQYPNGDISVFYEYCDSNLLISSMEKYVEDLFNKYVRNIFREFNAEETIYKKLICSDIDDFYQTLFILPPSGEMDVEISSETAEAIGQAPRAFTEFIGKAGFKSGFLHLFQQSGFRLAVLVTHQREYFPGFTDHQFQRATAGFALSWLVKENKVAISDALKKKISSLDKKISSSYPENILRPGDIKDEILSFFQADIIEINKGGFHILLKSPRAFHLYDIELMSIPDMAIQDIIGDEIIFQELDPENEIRSSESSVFRNNAKLFSDLYERVMFAFLEEGEGDFLLIGRVKSRYCREAGAARRLAPPALRSWADEFYHECFRMISRNICNGKISFPLSSGLPVHTGQEVAGHVVESPRGDEAAVDQEQVLRETCSSLPDPVFVLDADWNLRFFNDRFLDICKNRVVAVGDSLDECLVSRLCAPCLSWLRACVAGRIPEQQMFHLADRYGKARRMEFRLTRIGEKRGGAALILVRAVDVAHLQLANQELETACSVGGFGYWEFNPATGQMICSDHAARIMNWDSRSLMKGVSGLLLSIHEQDRTAFQQILRDPAREETAGEFRIYDPKGQIRFVHIDARRTGNQAGRGKRRLPASGLKASESKTSGFSWLSIPSGEDRLRDSGEERIFAVVQDVTARKRSAIELAESEARLKEAQRLARQGYFDLVPETGALHWSDGTYEIWGRDPWRDRLTLENLETWVHPEDRQAFHNDFRDRSWDERTSTCRIIRPDGEVRYLMVRMFRERDEMGRETRVFGLQQDVTELKKTELALRASTARLLDAQKVGLIGHWEADLNRRSVWWSDMVYELHGRKAPGEPDELKRGQKLNLDSYLQIVDRRDNGAVRRFWAELLDGQDASAEYRILHKASGDWRWLRCACQIEFDRHGQPVTATGILQDITEPRTAAEALRESRNWFRDLAACSSDIFWETSLDGRIDALAGSGSESLKDQLRDCLWSDLEILAQEREGIEVDRTISRSIGERVAFRNVDLPVRSVSEGLRWLRVSGVPRFAIDGAFKGYRGAVTDNTASHLATERDARQGKLVALGQLAGGVAHEINNQLQPILLLSEVGLKKLQGQEGQGTLRQCLDTIRNSAENARKIVRNTLLFARKEIAENRPLPVRKTVLEVIELLRQTLPSSVTLDAEIEEQDTLAIVNDTQITQIIMNLVKNATDAMENRGRVGVILRQSLKGDPVPAELAEKHPDLLCLAVEDDGCGMTAETKARALDPFYTTKPVGEGTGLGLPSVYGIVRAWGGDLVIDSIVGQGTRIALFIPVYSGDQDPESTGLLAAARNQGEAGAMTLPAGNGK